MIYHDMSESPYTSEYTGVYYNKDRDTWHAHLEVDGQKYREGGFDTEEEAYNARLELEHYYLHV